ncbi:MAG: hypothetical protein IJH84_07895, partial [Saccharopolyspora sp.]|uniref:hypothetical protein n=1 Tax=Saccharopolyspora sp. TaxID=33915 RepID=UPI0025FF2175
CFLFWLFRCGLFFDLLALSFGLGFCFLLELLRCACRSPSSGRGGGGVLPATGGQLTATSAASRSPPESCRDRRTSRHLLSPTARWTVRPCRHCAIRRTGRKQLCDATSKLAIRNLHLLRHNMHTTAVVMILCAAQIAGT